MAPRKRMKSVEEQDEEITKKLSKTELEKLICKKKLDALEREETKITLDRLSADEKIRLLDAYNDNGFQVFQEPKLLQRYLPDRCESDLKVLIQRLAANVQPSSAADGQKQTGPIGTLDEWQRFCQQLLNTYSRDKKVNIDDALADSLISLADTMSKDSERKVPDPNSEKDVLKPDYSKLIKSFAQLLQGKFPERMSSINAQMSMKLFNHISSFIDSIDLDQALMSIKNGSWMEVALNDEDALQEMALEGLKEINQGTKNCPSFRDIEKSRNIEALCLELPKVKRITDVLNPLKINELLVSDLMTLFNETST